MTYEEAVRWLTSQAERAKSGDPYASVGTQLVAVLEAVQAEHDRMSDLHSDLDARLARQTALLDQWYRERQACVDGALDPESVASEPMTTEEALATLGQLSAWFYRHQAPEFARDTSACRRALELERTRADRGC